MKYIPWLHFILISSFLVTIHFIFFVLYHFFTQQLKNINYIILENTLMQNNNVKRKKKTMTTLSNASSAATTTAAMNNRNNKRRNRFTATTIIVLYLVLIGSEVWLKCLNFLFVLSILPAEGLTALIPFPMG